MELGVGAFDAHARKNIITRVSDINLIKFGLLAAPKAPERAIRVKK